MCFELGEDRRRQQVAADDRERRRRVLRTRLFDDLFDDADAAFALFGRDDAVLVRLGARHGFDAEHAAAAFGVTLAIWRRHGVLASIRSSARCTKNGSSPTTGFAHHTAWPRPSGDGWRM